MSFHNVEAEQQLLGAILINNDLFALVGDFLQAEHFADPVHARIFEMAGARIAKGHLVSPVTMKLALESDEGLKELGGPAYLARMAGAAVASSMARDYGKVILEAACRRSLNESAAQAQEALSGGVDSAEVKLRLLHGLQALPEIGGEESSYSLLAAMTEATQDALASYRGEASFLQTGIASLDRVIKGLAPGDLMLLPGATSMGKTSLALEIAANVAIAQNKGVCFVSLEMTRQQLATRMASAVARVPYSSLRDAASMDEAEFRKWIEAAPAVGAGNMRIIPKHVRDIPAIHAAATRASSALKGGMSVLIVDYAQLVRAPGKDRYSQMTDVSIGLKTMAGMLNVPVIALCQLSRDIGNREDKRPQLSDIKETGQFENDADQVVFCHREQYWMERQGPKPDKRGNITEESKRDWQVDLAAVKNKMELITRKNRHGRLATAEIGFHDATNRFWSLDKSDDDGFR